jgi:hypothetical protein
MRQFGPTPIRKTLAACGKEHCNGCVDVGDGRKIHPPKPGAWYVNAKPNQPVLLPLTPHKRKKRKTVDSDDKDNLFYFTP